MGGQSEELFFRIAALLDPETPVPGVTDMSPAPELKGLGELAVTGKAAPDLALTARWGYPGQKGVTMPGPGKTTQGTRGEGFLDIHLNATTRWKDVPTEAWNYTLGGYQVLKSGLATASKSSSTAPSPPTKPSNSPTTPAASLRHSNKTPNWTLTTRSFRAGSCGVAPPFASPIPTSL